MGLIVDRDLIERICDEEILFSYEDIQKIIQFCLYQNIPVLGLEGFDKTGDSIILDINAIYDNSDGDLTSFKLGYLLFFHSVNDSKKKLWCIALEK